MDISNSGEGSRQTALIFGLGPKSLIVFYLPIFPDQASSPIEIESDYLPV
jgi:hypothetical protein